MAAREIAPFAALMNAQNGRPRRFSSAECRAFMAARENAPFALLMNAQNGRPAPLLFCGVPLFYGGAGNRALCAFDERAKRGCLAAFW
jgi:hypothetical protein